MSNCICDKCGAYLYDTNYGYVTGCTHYPPDAIAGWVECACGDKYPVDSAGGKHLKQYGVCENCKAANQ